MVDEESSGDANLSDDKSLGDNISSANNMPKHVAIVMDGNGRWAKSRGVSRIEGHKRGVEATKKAIYAAAEMKISCLTLFAFSRENWKRPSYEVNDLFLLMTQFIDKHLDELHSNNIKVTIIGSEANLSKNILANLKKVTEKTKDNTGLKLTIAFNYSSRDEIVRAVNSIIAAKIEEAKIAEAKKGGLNEAALKISEDEFANWLDTKDMPDPDLIIRTSGEKRLSNFLLWQAAYSELVFVEKLWPDFDKVDFKLAIEEFTKRSRRFGGL